MPDRSAYERHQIESLLHSGSGRFDPDIGLFLMTEDESTQRIHDAAVAPALRANGINVTSVVRVFGSESLVSEIGWWIQSARIIIADVSPANADLMYVLGLCHGLGRCPLLIMAEETELPFNLEALRCIEYDRRIEGLWKLRRQLTRVIRVGLRASG